MRVASCASCPRTQESAIEGRGQEGTSSSRRRPAARGCAATVLGTAVQRLLSAAGLARLELTDWRPGRAAQHGGAHFGAAHCASQGCCSICAAEARLWGLKLSMGSRKSRRASACGGAEGRAKLVRVKTCADMLLLASRPAQLHPSAEVLAPTFPES